MNPRAGRLGQSAGMLAIRNMEMGRGPYVVIPSFGAVKSCLRFEMVEMVETRRFGGGESQEELVRLIRGGSRRTNRRLDFLLH